MHRRNGRTILTCNPSKETKNNNIIFIFFISLAYQFLDYCQLSRIQSTIFPNQAMGVFMYVNIIFNMALL
jgi:hypothetical protein